MRQSRLPQGGVNLFQEIKAETRKAEGAGKRVIKLSIGQPAGSALLSARREAAGVVMLESESVHEYQDNGSPGCPGFAERFVAGHLQTPLTGADVAYLPIPGIKPMLGLIILACGSSLETVVTTTYPGYPTPKDWCGYLGKRVIEADTNPGNVFLFNPEDVLRIYAHRRVELIMINYPHNPSGAAQDLTWLANLCRNCASKGIRLVNDAAYSALRYDGNSCTLAEIAIQFPNLSWLELYSTSKLIGNGTGWRVGAAVGSPDFIGDLATIKGNTDSGFVAAMAAGALYAFEHDKVGIQAVVDLYRRRSQLLCQILTEAGMRLALKPQAGFFTLWQTPKFAFGRKVEDAKDFNFRMIAETGIVGVHFEPYIRYAVAYPDVERLEGEIRAAFAKAQVSY